MKDRTHETIKPFLRWAGGKTRSIPFLESHLPYNFQDIGTYYEPFLGAGSLFFHLTPKRSVLSDRNKDLIECYLAIKDNPKLVSKYLNQHKKRTNEKYYYQMREKYNRSRSSISRSALFLYLNKTCFNGIWRVNNKNEFNVPYGYKEPPHLPSGQELVSISKTLYTVKLLHLDYHDAVKYTKAGDFVYFDPPYPPLNGTSYFTHYTKERFSEDDHKELSEVALELSKKGCYVIISNSDTKYIRSLYDDNFNIYELEVVRLIRTDGKRYKVKEVAITNYEV